MTPSIPVAATKAITKKRRKRHPARHPRDPTKMVFSPRIPAF